MKKQICSMFSFITIVFPFSILLVRMLPHALEAPYAERTIYTYMVLIVLSFLYNLFITYKLHIRNMVTNAAVVCSGIYSVGCICMLFLIFK